jgi:hypothetical protein
VFENPSQALMIAVRDFVFRHEIFVEARELDDGFIFVRRPKGRSRRFGPRRHFEVFLRRNKRRVHFHTLKTVSGYRSRSISPRRGCCDRRGLRFEYEACGRDVKRSSAWFSKDVDGGRALFGYVRSESRLLERLLGDPAHRELLRLVRHHRRKSRSRPASQRLRGRQRGRR